ncbi:unnamed protein product [Chondrus crispus]|uniref:Uncharacterized protein n=1 Tax=Chondrus crispus TaxID=2769 RepID=R7QPQ9_CHOCR|nr:unnamed protein product [Chondrus crispus]CDF39768.1 unnamed protein product [Chondrus crispus]|eukprot:XP_005710062.1 unnamed protein product [Chondrus crispus]
MNAFVPASLARPVLRDSHFTPPLSSRSPVRPSVGPTMNTDIDLTLGKYDKMSRSETAPAVPSTPSSVWRSYLDTVNAKQCNPFEKPNKVSAPIVSRPFMNGVLYNAKMTKDYYEIRAIGTGFGSVPIGNPDKLCSPSPAVDSYMAKCVTAQYKMTAAPYGVYTIKCTEGNVKQQAEESRSAALSAEFRMKQRSVKAKFGDYTETRRKAIIAAMGCTYEEKLVNLYPVAARAVVRGSSEAKGNCVRYAVSTSPAEEYMAASVDKQYKFRAVPYGVYDVLCCDGNTKTVPEYKRVAALATRFRAKQMSLLAKERAKYESAKYARDYYGHGCSYEENIFNSYAAVSSSMRPDSARY